MILVHTEITTLCRDCAKAGREGSELVPEGAGPRVGPRVILPAYDGRTQKGGQLKMEVREEEDAMWGRD